MWFYLVKGRPHGPVSTADIEAEIKSRQLNARDLIYKDRDTHWREVSSFSEFSKLFKNGATAVDAVSKPEEKGPALPEVSAMRSARGSTESHWVLLVRKPDGSGYKQRGPFASSEIVHMLRHEEVLQTDYVWREGLKEWYKILAVSEIQELFNQKKEDTNTDTAPTLISMPPPPPPFLKGPDIEPKNEDKTVKDIEVWSDSETLEEKNQNAQPNKAEKTVEDLKITKVFPAPQLENSDIIHFQNKAAKSEADTTSRAENPAGKSDFVNKATVVSEKTLNKNQNPEDTGSKSVSQRESNREVRKGKKRPPKQEANVTRISLLRYYLQMTPINKALFLLSAMIFLVSIVWASLWLSSYQDRKNILLKLPQLAEIPPLPKVEVSHNQMPNEPQKQEYTPPQVTQQAAPSAPAAPPTVAAKPGEPRRPPTRLQIEKQNNNTEALQIRVVSDGSSHFSILVTIESMLGQVLDLPSVYIRKVIRTLEDRTFDVKALRIPPGEYRITVESEAAKATGLIAFGTAAKDFRSKLNTHRKRLTYDLNEERHNLMKVAARLENETLKLAQTADNSGELRSWSDSYKSWRRNFDRIHSSYINEVNSRNRQKYVLSGLWLQLKDLRSQVEKEAKSVNKAKVEKRKPTAAQLRSLGQAMGQVKEQAIQSSLWK